MTPDELEKLPKPLERIMTALEESIMIEVVDRIRETMEITPVIDWLLYRLSTIGASKSRIKKLIEESLEKSEKTVDDIYEQAIKSDYIRNKAIYEAAGKDYLPYSENQWLKEITEAVRQQTKDSLRQYENITQTTGFNIAIGGGKKVFTPLSEYLESSLDKAMMGIVTGTKSYSQAIGDVIDEMTASGIRVVDYASGKSDRIEVAARRAIMTGVAQLTDKVNEKNAEELETDYWEVDWHMGARNTGTGYENHQSWQGKVYSSEEMRTVCGLGEMLGFAGINCYHIRFPFIPGVSKRKYTDEWLEEQNRKENKKKAYSGKEYDTYAALQYQRRLERIMRKQKQDIMLLERAEADPDDIIAAKCRFQATAQTYTDFSKQMGLRQQMERLRIPKMFVTGVPEWKKIVKEPLRHYTKSELEELAEETRKIVQSHISASSHWSGKLVIDPPEEIYGKLWNCDISTMSETAPHILLHEQIHACSISNFDLETYINYWKIEEATVQFATQEICAKEGMENIESQYDGMVDCLRKTNDIVHFYESDYDFAVKLIEIPVPERLDWIREKMFDIMQNKGTLQDIQSVDELLTQLQ